MAKRAVIGFKGVALAEVTTDTVLAYTSEAAEALQYAGSMNKTAKEVTQDMYYDDNLYYAYKDVKGEDIELRLAEVPLARMAELGLGEFDATTNTLEADFSVVGKKYALRCVTDTVEKLPFYFNYRLFTLNGIKFDNFATKGSGITVCEVIITGTASRPEMASVRPLAVMQLAEDRSNLAACEAFLRNGETFPDVP